MPERKRELIRQIFGIRAARPAGEPPRPAPAPPTTSREAPRPADQPESPKDSASSS
jgi:hypothetical protein